MNPLRLDNKVRVTLSVLAAAKFGERIYAVGNHDALGAWDVDRALRLSTTPEAYPLWRCDLVVGLGEELEYKYVVKAKDEDGVWRLLRWEAVSANRRLKVAGERVEVQDGIIDDDHSATRPQRVAITRPVLSGSSNPPSPDVARSLPDLASAAQSAFHGDALVPDFDLVMVVTYKLPVSMQCDAAGNLTFQLIHTPMTRHVQDIADERGVKALWVGLLPSVISDDRQLARAKDALLMLNCVPVVCDDALVDHYSFCKLVLWPTMHSVPPDHHLQHQNAQLWRAYSTLNAAFASEVLRMRTAKSVVWVHGYQLLEVATHVRERAPDIRIGFTLHIPFPPSEDLRSLTPCNSILHGMLSYSVIGFLLFDHARHFLSACRRLMGLSVQTQFGGRLCLQYHDRPVSVAVSHVTVEPELFAQLPAHVDKPSHALPLELPNDAHSEHGAGAGAGWSVTVAEAELPPDELAALHRSILAHIPTGTDGQACKVVLGIDVMDYLTGTSLKLLAFERLLTDFDAWRGKVVLLQVSIARSGVPWSESQKKHEQKVTQLVDRINTAFKSGSYQPVVHIIKAPTRETRQFLYGLADVLLLTPIRDGLNVIPYEFVCCKHAQLNNNQLRGGSVVLSEFTGVSRSLSGALRVNPFSADKAAIALDTALTMSLEERSSRLVKDHHHIRNHSVSRWVRAFVEDVQQPSSVRGGSPHNQTQLLDALPDLQRAFSSASRRVILLDYSGAMVESWLVGSERVRPADKLVELLGVLGSDPRTTVFIVSGRSRQVLGSKVASPGIGLVAECGFVYKWSNDQEWKLLEPEADLSWKDIARPILHTYAEHTDNSSVLETAASFTFNFRDVDPELRDAQIHELVQHLSQSLAKHSVKVVLGPSTLQLYSADCGRYAFVKRLLATVVCSNDAAAPGTTLASPPSVPEAPPSPWFALCVGQAHNFVDVFALLERRAKGGGGGVACCTVRACESRAPYFVNGSQDLERVLAALVESDAAA